MPNQNLTPCRGSHLNPEIQVGFGGSQSQVLQQQGYGPVEACAPLFRPSLFNPSHTKTKNEE